VAQGERADPTPVVMVTVKRGPGESELQTRRNHQEVILGEGEYFLYSDLVQNSSDSRIGDRCKSSSC
jgi:hypothetical protein